MSMQKQVPSESDIYPGNSDGDLVLAYVGSIGVGGISPIVPGAIFDLWRCVPMASILGAICGLFWGMLTVIVIAAVGCELRRHATMWMFAILSAGVMLLSSVWWLHLSDY